MNKQQKSATQRGIEWTSRRAATYKTAAKRIGVAYTEYLKNINAGLKWCFRCRTWLHKLGFCIDKNRGDGLSASCRECRNSRARKIKINSAPSINVQQRASSAVSYAVKTGRMASIKLQICSGCGKRADHYHHHLGYEDAHILDVIPLCVACHRKSHYASEVK